MIARDWLIGFLLFLSAQVAWGNPTLACLDDALNGRTLGKALEQHRKQQTLDPLKAVKLDFVVEEGKDVYNPTAPFDIGKYEGVIAGRVESRTSESDTEVRFFMKNPNGKYEQIPGSPVFRLQDPFVTRIRGETVFGGVEVFEQKKGKLAYRTVFYRGKSLNDLKQFFEGPIGMKDIRLAKTASGEIAVFTRPQGEIRRPDGTKINAGKGKVGFTVIQDLNELTTAKILSAPLLENLMGAHEWGGVNEAHLLKNGKLGVLAHVASFDGRGKRHYYSAVFSYDPVTGKHTPLKIIAERKDLQAVSATPPVSKRPDLMDVIFSGGLIRGADGKSEIYLGAGDAEAYQAVSADPFLEYELGVR